MSNNTHKHILLSYQTRYKNTYKLLLNPSMLRFINQITELSVLKSIKTIVLTSFFSVFFKEF